MGLFSKKEAPVPPAPAWSPKVDLAVAREIVFALAKAPISDDMQVRSAIAAFVRASERPPLEKALDLQRQEPEVLHRPWIWLAAVMREASAAGDNHLAAAALYWACYWTSNLVPRNNLGAFMELELDPIPGPRKAELAALGIASARQLAPDFVIVGNETGEIQAGPLADSAPEMLDV
jgi:hypothetical protein